MRTSVDASVGAIRVTGRVKREINRGLAFVELTTFDLMGPVVLAIARSVDIPYEDVQLELVAPDQAQHLRRVRRSIGRNDERRQLRPVLIVARRKWYGPLADERF